MQEDNHNLENQLSIVDGKVTSILSLLKGNELDKDDKGMIGVQNDHEKRIAKLEKIWDRVFWFLIGLSMFAGWGLFDIIQKLLLK